MHDAYTSQVPQDQPADDAIDWPIDDPIPFELTDRAAS